MHVPMWVWLATIGGIAALFLFDFLVHVRKLHHPSLKEAGVWSTFYIVVALLFGAGLWWVWGHDHGVEYLAGYITEKSLSVDNLFVFVIIMTKFQVPADFQQKALLIGIVIALVMRGIFIAIGGAAIDQFSWVFYLFGIFLLWTAYTLAKESLTGGHVQGDDYEPNALVRFIERRLPVTEDYRRAALVVREKGRLLVTPMFVVIVALGVTDLLFALDSIPAIYGLTEEPYIVFTANAFALLGLLQLYFLIGGLLDRLVYLGAGLALILAFIGVKLVFHAMEKNTLPFINGGEGIAAVPHISTWLSLGIIVSILAITTIASLVASRNGASHGKNPARAEKQV